MNDIRLNIELLAGEITERHAQRSPEVFARYGPFGKIRCREDARFHLDYLSVAFETESPVFFTDYIAWAKIMLAARNVPSSDLVNNLRVMREVLFDRLNEETSKAAIAIVNAAIDALPSMPLEVPSFIDPSTPNGRLAKTYIDFVLEGQRDKAAQLLIDAVEHGLSPTDFYLGVIEPVQDEIGRLWQQNIITVAQEHLTTAATQQIIARVYTRFPPALPSGKSLVAMCAGGELHELGLRIVTDLLELNGWQTLYLGANVPRQSAMQLCIDRGVDALLVSATTTPQIPEVAEIIRLFRQTADLKSARVVVGGRAFSCDPQLWRRLGADHYARHAEEALALMAGI